MAAAKAARSNPREIAGAVADALRDSHLVASADVAGPGFINVRLSAACLAERANAIARDARAGAGQVEKPRRVVMDFGGWNLAKEMHIGHLRSTVIGDSLQRLFRFVGDHVTSDVHLGDWGLQMGQLINEVRLEQPELSYFDAGFTGPYPEESPVTMDDLGRFYPQASAKSKADEARREADRKATAELQTGRPGYRALWHHFCNVTCVGLERECASLGVAFDLWKGESDAELERQRETRLALCAGAGDAQAVGARARPDRHRDAGTDVGRDTAWPHSAWSRFPLTLKHSHALSWPGLSGRPEFLWR
jgi:arginyl-tRNA synthetase